MAYTKIAPGDFISKLENDGYASATAARRAVGKAAFSPRGKKQCYEAIDKHFKTSSKEAPASKKVTKKRKSTGKKAAKAKAAAPKKSAAPKAADKSKGKIAKKKGAAKATRAARKGMFNVGEDALAEIHLAKERVGTITQALNAMKLAKDVSPDVNFTSGVQNAQDALSDVVAGVHSTVRTTRPVTEAVPPPAAPDNGVDPAVAKGFAESAPASVPLPGQTSPVQVPPAPAGDAG